MHVLDHWIGVGNAYPVIVTTRKEYCFVAENLLYTTVLLDSFYIL